MVTGAGIITGTIRSAIRRAIRRCPDRSRQHSPPMHTCQQAEPVSSVTTWGPSPTDGFSCSGIGRDGGDRAHCGIIGQR